jgi:hypothetical protein
MKGVRKMEITRQHLHDVIDTINTKELDVLYHILCKFISEDTPYPDEIEAIKQGRAEIERGEYVRMEDIDWN